MTEEGMMLHADGPIRADPRTLQGHAPCKTLRLLSVLASLLSYGASQGCII